MIIRYSPFEKRLYGLWTLSDLSILDENKHLWNISVFLGQHAFMLFYNIVQDDNKSHDKILIMQQMKDIPGTYTFMAAVHNWVLMMLIPTAKRYKLASVWLRTLKCLLHTCVESFQIFLPEIATNNNFSMSMCVPAGAEIMLVCGKWSLASLPAWTW